MLQEYKQYSNMEKITFRDYSFDKPYIDKFTRQGTWVKFDVDNLYPERVMEIVNQSPLQKSILESKKTYILGAGLENPSENIYTPNMYESWFDLIEKCTNDLVYLNAMAVQVILNESGNRFSFYYQPVQQVRFANYNEHNVIEKAYLCTDWRKAQKNKNVVEIPMFGSETPKKGKAYLLYFKPEQVGEYYYAIPEYMSASNYIMADGDNTYPASFAPQLMRYVEKGEADMVIGDRLSSSYFRENKLFWTRRITGFVLIIPLLMHLLIFSGTGDEAYRLVFFHSGRLISQILLIAALALHILTNIRPALIGLGIKAGRLLSADICFVLSVVLLLCCCAFCVYYLRWMTF